MILSQFGRRVGVSGRGEDGVMSIRRLAGATANRDTGAESDHHENDGGADYLVAGS